MLQFNLIVRPCLQKDFSVNHFLYGQREWKAVLDFMSLDKNPNEDEFDAMWRE
jgi:hypothetical protein